MVNVGQTLTLTIDDLAGTAGIGRVDGFAVMTPGALPGETVRVTIQKTAKRYATAQLDAVLSASSHRVAPPCPYYGRCGGCQLQHLDYSRQQLAKQQQVQDALQRIGGFTEANVLPTLGMEHPWRYRNKAVFQVAPGLDGAVRVGFYTADGDGVMDIQDCLLQHPNAAQAAQGLREAMTQIGLSAYDARRHTGLVRHLMVRTSSVDQGAMAVIAINGQQLPDEKRLVSLMRQACPSLQSILISANTHRTPVVLGQSAHLIWGKPTLQEKLMGNTFQVSPHSFFQVNHLQTQKLYQAAMDAASLMPDQNALDLYCGTGSITLTLAANAQEVAGIEVVQAAIDDARAAAAANNVNNVHFYAGDAAVKLPQVAAMLAAQNKLVDVAVLDPPRKGCDAKVLQALVAIAPQRIVYVSCNPATQARDVAWLAQSGYQLVQAQPVDMFAQTGHVESIILMTHCGSEGKK